MKAEDPPPSSTSATTNPTHTLDPPPPAAEPPQPRSSPPRKQQSQVLIPPMDPNTLYSGGGIRFVNLCLFLSFQFQFFPPIFHLLIDESHVKFLVAILCEL